MFECYIGKTVLITAKFTEQWFFCLSLDLKYSHVKNYAGKKRYVFYNNVVKPKIRRKKYGPKVFF